MFNTWDEPLSSDKFMSIVVMSYTRPKFLKACLESIHRHADMPFEIIVHDDASGRELEVEIFNECRHLCSSLIFSSPERINLGLATAANRATALANSDYVLLLNDDCVLTGGTPFQLIKKVLDVPYIACVGPWQTVTNVIPGSVSPGQTQVPVTANGVDFNISSLPNGAGIFAYKKSAWEEIRGFPQVYTNAGDTGFHIQFLKHGYFNASKLINVEEMFTNVDQDAGYLQPTAGKSPFDSSYPHIFGIDIKDLARHCELRRQRIYEYSHINYYCDEGIVNHAWWDRFFCEARKDVDHGFNWDVFKAYGQDKWKDQVEADMAAWRNKKNNSSIIQL
jgi:glycosyltransferase involved in cell wall biosynthesis